MGAILFLSIQRFQVVLRCANFLLQHIVFYLVFRQLLFDIHGENLSMPKQYAIFRLSILVKVGYRNLERITLTSLVTFSKVAASIWGNDVLI